ncbi:hypothetical protein L1049_007535 [Liquidambar formosana]|uniref:Uncharacterized protein n=1 Tax=Liquidambar formosana TaxID=63359 RepID=A0AAP0S200_LIQFO
MEKSVILLSSSSDDEDERLREAKKRKCMDAGKSSGAIHACRSDDEFRVLSDLSGYQNLAAMMAAEASMRRKNRNRRRRRKKKNKKIEFNPLEGMAVDTEKEGQQVDTVKTVETTEVVEKEPVLISENGMPQGLVADGAKEGTLMDTFEDVKMTKAFEAGDGVTPVIVIDLCLSSVEEDEVVADLSSSKSVGEMVAAEPILRKKKKRRRRKKEKRSAAQVEIIDVVKEGKQPYIVKAMETTKALKPESVPITENIGTQKLTVDAAKEEEQADTSKHVEKTKEIEDVVGIGSSIVIDLCLSSSEEDEVIRVLGGSRGVDEMLLAESIIDAAKGEQLEKIEAVETTKALETDSIPVTELIVPLSEAKQVDMGKGIEAVISCGTESVEIEDNVVLRQLLRKPRYFDPPESRWGMCRHCGEENHAAVNCTAQKRKKPCFVCGGLEHSGKRCKQGHHCFYCKGMGHIAKHCPEKHQGNNLSSEICLKCGDSGHDMWSCSSGYSPDDLKAIQCYVCQSVGHLCCSDFPDAGTKQVSCYNCGQSGHLGSGCPKSCEKASGSRSSTLCFRCGEEGHFARECKKYAKGEKTLGNLSTPQKPKKNRDSLGSKSAPQDLCKAPKKKKDQDKEGVGMIAGQSWWRDGRIANGPAYFFNREARSNVWVSPSLSTQKNQEISTFCAPGPFVRPQYPYEMFNHPPAGSSSQPYQPIFPTSWFGNFGSG